MTAGELRRGRQRSGHHGHAAGHVLHHLGGKRVPEVRLIVQQRQAGQRAVEHRHGLVVRHEATPAQQARRLRRLDLRPGSRVGRPDQLHRDAARAQQPGQLDHVGGASVGRQVPDVHHPPVIARRSRDIRHVGGVRHHRVRPGEPGDVSALGQDQVHVPLGHPFRGMHRHGGGRPERARRNRLELERRPGPFGIKILGIHRGDVRDLVTGIEQSAYLPVVDARVGRMMNDRAHHDPHHALPPGQRASTCGVDGVFCTAPRVSSRSRAVRAIWARS